jgi:hypothetical protein
MKYTKDKLLDVGVERLRHFGFVNVNRRNVLEDEVYAYHLKRYLSLLLGKNNDQDSIIKELITLIDKK